MKENQFWDLDLTDLEIKAGIKWFKNKELVGLVDEKSGGVIGYIHSAHIKRILRKVNNK
jgi:hypothetical protein